MGLSGDARVVGQEACMLAWRQRRLAGGLQPVTREGRLSLGYVARLHVLPCSGGLRRTRHPVWRPWRLFVYHFHPFLYTFGPNPSTQKLLLVLLPPSSNQLEIMSPKLELSAVPSLHAFCANRKKFDKQGVRHRPDAFWGVFLACASCTRTGH